MNKNTEILPNGNMTTLERIREIEQFAERHGISKRSMFLLKAFNVMREIAIEANNKSGDDFGNRAFGDDFEMLDAIDKEFEDRMSAGEGK